MKKGTGLAFIIAVSMVSQATCSSDERWRLGAAKCESDVWSCKYFVKNDEASVYKTPSATSEVLFTQSRMHGGYASHSDLKSNRSWVRVYPQIMRGAEASTPDFAWISRSDIIPANEFKPVIGCWPVKYLYIVIGDYDEAYIMGVDGSIKSPDGTGNIGHIYMNDGMFYARMKSETGWQVPEGLFGLFDSENGRIINSWNAIDRQDLFSMDELKGCTSGPELGENAAR